MKFVVLIVIFVSVVNAAVDDIKKEINEFLYDISDISAEEKIFKFIDHSTSFVDEEEGPQLDYVSDTSDEEEIFEDIDDVRDRPSDLNDDLWSEINGNICLEGKGKEVELKMAVNKRPRTKREDEGRVVFTTCHDMDTAQNYYTTYKIEPTNQGRENNRGTKLYWRIPDFFAAQNVDDLYTNHRDIIEEILGTRDWLEERSEGLFLVKGHLAAKADFDDCREKELSSSFLNLAPQFQSFNNGNWKSVEYWIRYFAQKSLTGFTIHAGTHGVGMLWNPFNETEKIYLGENSTVPMPMLFYKMVIDKNLNAGIVLIGVNNPYLNEEKIKEDYIICNDIADELKWLNKNTRKNITKGYIYACSVGDFIQTVKIPITPIPNLILT